MGLDGGDGCLHRSSWCKICVFLLYISHLVQCYGNIYVLDLHIEVILHIVVSITVKWRNVIIFYPYMSISGVMEPQRAISWESCGVSASRPRMG